MTLRNANRMLIIISVLLTAVSAGIAEGIPYAYNLNVASLLLILHLLLLTASFLNDKLIDILISTLLIFYVSRIGVLQIDLSYYYYNNIYHNPPSQQEMADILLLLFYVSFGLLLGCFFGRLKRSTSALKINLYNVPEHDERVYYRYILLVVIISKLIIIWAGLNSGAGLKISLENIDIFYLRLVKYATFLSSLDIVPIAWLILQKPIGKEKKATIIAITLCVITGLFTLSKVTLIYAILPFIIVYYIAGLPIPKRLYKALWVIVFISLFVIFPLMVALQGFIVAELFGGGGGNIVDSFSQSHSILNLLLTASTRIYSSYDVFCFVFLNKNEFISHSNLFNEFVEVINGFYPGGFWSIDVPRWSQILFSVANRQIDLDLLMKIGTGDNISLPGHIFVYYGGLGLFILSFIVMYYYSVIYNTNNSVFVKYFIISQIIFGISNGAGLVNSLLLFPLTFIYITFFHLSYLLMRQVLRFLKLSGTKCVETCVLNP